MKAIVKFIITAPEDCSKKQFIEWVKGEIGICPSDTKNPLYVYDLKKHVKNAKIEIEKWEKN